MRRLFSVLIVVCFGISSANSQVCGVKNTSFTFGEKVNYTIYYHLAGLWVSAGEVYFNVDSANFGNKSYYHFNSFGTTYKKYDWLHKVRDYYETYTNSENFEPLRFKRKVNEGNTYIREDYVFNHKKRKVYTLRQMEEDEPIVKDTVSYESCSYDALTMIYYARNLDYSSVKVNDKIPIKVFIDNESHDSFIRFLGREKLKIKDVGEFNCIMFSPLLIEGTIFNEGEDMTVWVTDDENRVPILIETPILVGSIRARLKNMSGLRHPLTSKISE